MDKEVSEFLNDPKILYSIVVVLIFAFVVISIDIYNGFNNHYVDYDKKLKDPFTIQEEYGGGVIVSWDSDTDKITGIRRQDYTVMPKEGALSVTSDEADKIGRENLPKNVVIIPSDKTYYEILRDRK